MTELLLGRGDTFPRTFMDTFRYSRNEPIYNELKASKSDELILQNPSDIPISCEIHHGRSESILDVPGEEELNTCLQNSEVIRPNTCRKSKRISVYDKVDPEDSIRDIVSENDFYKFVLFKKHYDKYLLLSQKYEEAKNVAYYLEEKYHELKMERDALLSKKEDLQQRLESCESLVRDKEDEVFVQFERVLYLEEQCEKLLLQTQESEKTIKKLEAARHELVKHMTKLRDEKECLEKENDQLKETLETERQGMKRYINELRKKKNEMEHNRRQTELERNANLTSQFQKAVQHLATCKRKKCSVCTYTKSVYTKSSNSRQKDKKLLGCLQTPFLEMRNIIKPPPSPIHGEGASLSEWFCPLYDANDDEEDSSECGSLSIPFGEMGISYIDDSSDTLSSTFDHDKPDGSSNLGATSSSMRGFESDSGFSSDLCTNYTMTASTPREKFSPYTPPATLDESECAKLTRTKWTASFRKLIKIIKK
ncbi:rootletin-like [Coccinella septempunctata]|uniref:rootletin-like n=1 Tax=Coccinella septempunctata TaxID=41139 RepID=UPI001D0854B9|nr:rootletin-like [Coccinella septempunctata]